MAGEFATKFFGDFGADVIKVEKPGEGSLTRRWGPFPGDVPNAEASALFLHLNINKRSVTLNLAAPTGRDLLLRLAATADLVVESFRPGTLERLGIGPARAAAQRNPSAVVTRISAFGQDGPYRDYEATGLVLQAMGGPMNATGRAGRPPHRKPGLLEHYTIGRMAAEASLGGLFGPRRRARPRPVIDVSGMETLLAGADRRASYLLTAAYSGMNAPRGVRSAHRGAATFTGPTAARTASSCSTSPTPAFWDRLVDLVARRRRGVPAGLPEPVRPGAGPEFDAFIDRVQAWFAARPKLEIMELGEAMRIPLTAFLDVGELHGERALPRARLFVPADPPGGRDAGVSRAAVADAIAAGSCGRPLRCSAPTQPTCSKQVGIGDGPAAVARSGRHRRRRSCRIHSRASGSST